MDDVHVEAAFEVTGWDEAPFDDVDGADKLTEAVVAKKYSGALEGTSQTRWLLAYAADGTASFVGLERIRAWLQGKSGTLVLLHDGGFADGVASGTLRVLSGTDELAAATGAGTFRADPGGAVSLDLRL